MTKIYVKLKDTTGSCYVFSQGVNVVRTKIVEVQKNKEIQKMLEHGGLIEVTKQEFDTYQKNRDKSLKKKPYDDNNSKTKVLIENAFSSMDKKSWEYAFFSFDDYSLFVDLLVNFFEQREYELPKTIQVKNRCKSKLGSVIGDVYSDLGDVLKSDIEFIKITKVLNCFENEMDKTIIQILQR